MRRAVRIAVLVVVSYLLQAVTLPHLKIAGLMVEAVTIALFTTGYVMGLYAGLMAGMFSALIMEVLAGDLPGLTAFLCIAAGAGGGWIAPRVMRISKAGKRGLEQVIKRFAPMALIAAFVLFKESIYVMYFYLTGMEIAFSHIARAVLSGLINGALSLIAYPFVRWIIIRPPRRRAAKWLERRQEKGTGRAERPAREGRRPRRRPAPATAIEALRAGIKGGIDS